MQLHGFTCPQPIYTDAYLYEAGVLDTIEKFRETIVGAIHENADRMPAEWELVLDPAEDESPEERVCYYYFVNCSNRTLFWLHEFDVTPLLYGLDEIKSTRRIRESIFPTHQLSPLVILDCRSGIGELLLVSLH